MTLQRIPLTIICTLSGAETDGVLVAVMADDLAALEAEHDRLTAEVERLRGVVTEAVEAMQFSVEKDAGGFAVDFVAAYVFDGQPLPEIAEPWDRLLYTALTALVALTTDGGA